MNKTNGWLLALGLLLFSCGVSAQGAHIGNGVYACDGAAQAGPCQPEGYDDEVSAPQSRRVWHKTWGAIAENASGDTGVSAGKFSKQEANQDALRKCQGFGTGSCSVSLSYENQCVVIADTVDKNSRRKTINQTGATVKVASKKAIMACESANNRAECEVIYSACSQPVLMQ